MIRSDAAFEGNNDLTVDRISPVPPCRREDTEGQGRHKRTMTVIKASGNHLLHLTRPSQHPTASLRNRMRLRLRLPSFSSAAREVKFHLVES
jgi:hypothetical protein